jgi:TP901 family phage tail tape measure protein
MTTVANLLVQISADTAQLRSGLRGAETQLDRFTSGVENLGNRLRSFGGNLGQLTGPLQGLGTAGLEVASSFENVVTQLSTFGGLAGDELEAVKDKALELGEATMFSATDAANAMLELAKSGMGVSTAMDVADDAMNLAAVGQMSMAEAAGVVSSTLAQFSLDAGDAADVVQTLTAAASASRSEIDTLAQGLSNVGPVAAQFGLSLDETAAALAVFSNAGIEGAEAGTQLKSLLLSLGTSDTAAAALDRLGLSFDGVINGTQSLDEFLDQVAVSLADLPAAEQAVVMKDLAGAYGITGFSALLAAGGIDSMQTSMEGAPQAADIASAAMQTFSGRVDGLMGSVETLAINALTPLMDTLGEIATAVTPIVNDLSAWAEANPETARTIGLIGAALVVATPLVIGIGTAMTLAAPAIGLLGGAIGLVLGPVGLLVIGITALSALISNPAIQQGLSAWGGILENFGTIISHVAGQIATGLEDASSALTTGLNIMARDFEAGLLDLQMKAAGAQIALGINVGGNEAFIQDTSLELQVIDLARRFEAQANASLAGQEVTIDVGQLEYITSGEANAQFGTDVLQRLADQIADPGVFADLAQQAIATNNTEALTAILPLTLELAEDPAAQLIELTQTALADGTLDAAEIAVLTPIAQELEIDLDNLITQFQTAADTATAAPFDTTMTANVTLQPGNVDTTPLMNFINSRIASMGASVSGGAGGGGGMVPALATGGYIQSEGLAYLHAGEVVLNRDQQAAFAGSNRGGNVYNVTAYGQTMFDVLEMTRKAAERESY